MVKKAVSARTKKREEYRVTGPLSNLTIRVRYPRENPAETLRDITTALRAAGLFDGIRSDSVQNAKQKYANMK